MKDIAVSFTILRTLSVPDNYTENLVDSLIDNELEELNIDRSEINDIEWSELKR